MARAVRAAVLMSLVGVLSACMARLGTADLPGALVVKADAERLRIQLVGDGQQARLVELAAWQSYEPGGPFPVVWEGRLQAQEIRIPRRDAQRDRLYSRFRLVAADTGQPLGPPVWATDLSELPARVCDMPWPKSIKGVTCPVDLDDLEALGAKYVDTNVVLGSLLDWRAAWFEAEDGRRYPTLFQHPPAERHGTTGLATFGVPLPACAEGERLVLRFGTVLTGKDTTNGVRFAILLDDKEIWRHTQRAGAAADHAIDLTEYAGRRLELTLSVDSLGDARFDWANWVRPVIVRGR